MDYRQLRDAIDGFHAHELGATDSGITDASLWNEVRAHFAALGSQERGALVEEIVRDLTAPPGYGQDDADELRAWLRDSGLFPA